MHCECEKCLKERIEYLENVIEDIKTFATSKGYTLIVEMIHNVE